MGAPPGGAPEPAPHGPAIFCFGGPGARSRSRSAASVLKLVAEASAPGSFGSQASAQPLLQALGKQKWMCLGQGTSTPPTNIYIYIYIHMYTYICVYGGFRFGSLQTKPKRVPSKQTAVRVALASCAGAFLSPERLVDWGAAGQWWQCPHLRAAVDGRRPPGAHHPELLGALAATSTERLKRENRERERAESLFASPDDCARRRGSHRRCPPSATPRLRSSAGRRARPLRHMARLKAQL